MVAATPPRGCCGSQARLPDVAGATASASAPAPYTAELIAFLIETHWLAERDAGDRCAIGRAIARAVTRN